jgi:hypothetical protein
VGRQPPERLDLSQVVHLRGGGCRRVPGSRVSMLAALSRACTGAAAPVPGAGPARGWPAAGCSTCAHYPGVCTLVPRSRRALRQQQRQACAAHACAARCPAPCAAHLVDAVEVVFHALDGHVLAILNALRLEHLAEGPLALLGDQAVLWGCGAVREQGTESGPARSRGSPPWPWRTGPHASGVDATERRSHHAAGRVERSARSYCAWLVPGAPSSRAHGTRPPALQPSDAFISFARASFQRLRPLGSRSGRACRQAGGTSRGASARW